jgi:pyruvate,water dikinase
VVRIACGFRSRISGASRWARGLLYIHVVAHPMQSARRLAVTIALAVACIAAACGGDGKGEPEPPLKLNYATRLETEAEFDALAANDLVKFLARAEGREPPLPEDCYFQNTEKYPYHLDFLRAEFAALATFDVETYLALVLNGETRVWWGGALGRFDVVRHPVTGKRGVYALFVYGDAALGNITVAGIEDVWARMESCAPLAADKLVFVPEYDQEDLVRAAEDELLAAGIPVLYRDQLTRGEYAAYSVGENYGYLHIVPEGTRPDVEAIGPEDVLVVEGAPANLSLVAGLISSELQPEYSHTNLRLREKGIPNAYWAHVYEDESILALKDQLVHVVTTDDAVTVEAASLEDAEAFWAAHRPDLGPLDSDLDVTTLGELTALRHDDALAYGVKAANLGELNVALPAENTAQGFAIPLSAYVAFLAANGIDEDVATLLGDARLKTDRAFRANALGTLRDAIKSAPLHAGFFAGLEAQIRASFGEEAETTYLRFRSSTNAEDLEAFSGAGLYDSKTGCLGDDLDGDALGPSKCLSAEFEAFLEARIAARTAEYAAHPERWWLPDLIDEDQEDLTEEKPVADAVRKVWASLWNLRAFDERDYYGIEHDEAFMAMAVIPSFVMEEKEAVAVTHLIFEGIELPVYRVVSQLGDVGVVRPSIPTAVPETMTFSRDGGGATEFAFPVLSSLADGETVWSEAEREELAELLFLAHDHFAANVYPSISPLHLDIEIERTVDGRTVLKQARPYLGDGGP